MASIVKMKNKRSGITYLYQSQSYWDKEKQAPRARRICIGKIDPETGETVYNRKYSSPAAQAVVRDDVHIASSSIVGPSLVLSAASDSLKLPQVLRASMGSPLAEQILALAWYLVDQHSPMYLAESWMQTHFNPCKKPLTSARISGVLRQITPGLIQGFFKRWIALRQESEYLCYDISSVSSYASGNEFVEYGYNRDRESLPQVNMALISGIHSAVPVYYNLLPGSLTDVKTLEELLAHAKKLGITKAHLIMDRGFYSSKNLQMLRDGNYKFIIPLPAHVKLVHEIIDAYRDKIEMPDTLIQVSEDTRSALYGMSIYRKTPEGKRMWYHLYFDTARRTSYILDFFENLTMWEAELTQQRLVDSHQWAYDQYFIVKTTPKRGRTVTRNMEAIHAYKQSYAGYWILATNCEKDTKQALEYYRQRSRVEQHFDNLKNELDLNRLRIHDAQAMHGRVLIQFVALIVLQEVRNTLARSTSMRKYTVKEALWRLASYTELTFSGTYGTVRSTATKSQREILELFGVPHS